MSKKKILSLKVLQCNQSVNKQPITKQKIVSNKPKQTIDTISIESASDIVTVDVVNAHCDIRMYSLQVFNLIPIQTEGVSLAYFTL